MNNTITWEQAIKFDKVVDVAELNTQKLQESVKMFAKNSLLQMMCGDKMMRALELLDYYSKKDYSQFLFNETEKYFIDLEENEDIKRILNMTPAFIEIAKRNSELLLNEIKNKKDD